MKRLTDVRSTRMPPGCQACVKESVNHKDHEMSGGCLEGIQAIINPPAIRPTSPPLDSICVKNELYLKKNITIDIPLRTKKQLPCAMCLEYNIRDPDTRFFRTALDGSIECEDHEGSLEYGYIPSIFTLYKNTTVHKVSKNIEYTCGCNGCIRQALQYYSGFIAKDNSISSAENYGFH